MIGRKKILLDMKSDDLRTIEGAISAYQQAFRTHSNNVVDIKRLIGYRNGKQTIMSKVKEVRPEINNKVVINHAQMITRNIVGYFLGTPIQYIQTGANGKEEIEMLNKALAYEGKSSNDLDIGTYQSICGTAYRIIFADDKEDLIPFEDRALDPTNTFVAYENTIADRPLFGCTYVQTENILGETTFYKIFIYTDFGVYNIITDDISLATDNYEYEFIPYNVGGVPIIEYPNNIWRIGDWELAIELMDAINSLQSGRLDDIDQIVQSLIVFVNADISLDEYQEMRKAGIVSIKNNSNAKTEVTELSASLDQTGMNMFAKELEELLYAIIGIPDRNNRAGGGADTGVAVELRDGWADLEVVARNKERQFKKSEQMTLKIILTILGNKNIMKLSPLDVDIKFSRNKNNNLLVKTQSLQTLLASKILAPADCLTIVDLVSDVNEYISRGEAFWGNNFANNIKPQVSTDTIDETVDENEQIDETMEE